MVATSMKNIINEADLRKLVLDVVRQRLPHAQIRDVLVSRDTDFDGDPIITIKVVIEGARLDAEKTSTLTRHMRNTLHSAGDEAFPLFSFIAKSEAGSLAPARA